jgi:cation:H+ antiporter
MFQLIGAFTGLALVIVIAGHYLAAFADVISERSGLGRTLTGIVLLATATSMPELAVDCSAALIGAVDLAVGDLLGSSLMNLLILGMIDLTHFSKGRMLSPMAAAHALSASMSILLTALVLLALLIRPEWTVFGLGPGAVIVFLAYLFGLRLVYFDQRAAAQVDEYAGASPSTTLYRAVLGFLAMTAVILLAAPALAYVADRLADETGLGGTFVGTTLVALTTSLPEIVTTLAAARMGAHNLAVGNILGSNSFNMALLLPVDAFYRGNLLAVASATHAISAATIIIVSTVATMGLLYRAEKRLFFLEPDALLVVGLVLGSLGLVYAHR